MEPVGSLRCSHHYGSESCFSHFNPVHTFRHNLHFNKLLSTPGYTNWPPSVRLYMHGVRKQGARWYKCTTLGF